MIQKGPCGRSSKSRESRGSGRHPATIRSDRFWNSHASYRRRSVSRTHSRRRPGRSGTRERERDECHSSGRSAAEAVASGHAPLLLPFALFLLACGDDGGSSETAATSGGNGGSSGDGGAKSTQASGDGGGSPASTAGNGGASSSNSTSSNTATTSSATDVGGGGASGGSVLLELLSQRYVSSREPLHIVAVRLTNVEVDEPIGVGSDRYSLNVGGVIRDALDPDLTSDPCEADVSLAVGGSYECEVAFPASAAGGTAILLYADPDSGATADVDVPAVDMNSSYADCQQSFGGDGGNHDCQSCVVDQSEACRSAFNSWRGDCLCNGEGVGANQAATGSSGMNPTFSVECCQEMDVQPACEFPPTLETCVANCSECQ